jgi:hypothetical protein
MGEHTWANGIGHATLYMKEGSLFCSVCIIFQQPNMNGKYAWIEW